MRAYKQWTPEERWASLAKTNEAIAKGIIPKATVCNRCGQDKGIVEYHNEDYSDPIKYLEPLCYRCHMAVHVNYRAPEAVKKYFDLIKEGFRFPPVYKRNFWILRRDHGF